jgi:23S rRNA pseudouridine1911/1915/1917 synthase
VGLPVLGDPLYGGGRALSRSFGLDRQGLHAALLGFDHPEGKGRLRFVSPLPADLLQVLERIRP